MLNPERLAALRAERDELARVAAIAHARIAAARLTGRQYAATRLSYAEILELGRMRGVPDCPFGFSGPTATVRRLAPGAGLTCRAEVNAFLEGAADVAAML